MAYKKFTNSTRGHLPLSALAPSLVMARGQCCQQWPPDTGRQLIVC